MATEIERKFLPKNDEWRQGQPIYYCQGYLNVDKHRTVRVRVVDDKAMLTIKGISTGVSRLEFEYAIPLNDAEQMLELCDKPLIEKYRRELLHADQLWQVDEFLGDNAGLVVAEIELMAEDQEFSKPAWVGEEVSHDPRYFNSALSKYPYKDWN